ncbi:MAG: heavy-metal-associated domain-containing protein [Geobacter sp.]|nr:MAG: heavy-metal-associated domain-containing protein [Geobacter sp.]
MKLNKTKTSFLVITALILLVVLAFHVRVGVTADSVAVLKTNGMTCGSCSSKISKALESVDGVAVTEVDIAGGWVIVGYDTRTVKPESLAEKVKRTGFDSNVHVVLTPEQFKQITGRVIGQNSAASKGCGGGCAGSK